MIYEFENKWHKKYISSTFTFVFLIVYYIVRKKLINEHWGDLFWFTSVGVFISVRLILIFFTKIKDEESKNKETETNSY